MKKTIGTAIAVLAAGSLVYAEETPVKQDAAAQPDQAAEETAVEKEETPPLVADAEEVDEAAQEKAMKKPAEEQAEETDSTEKEVAAEEQTEESDVTVEEVKKMAATMTPSLFDSRQLVGLDVTNPNGDTIADVEKLLMDDKGEIHFAVLGTGGFLDLGERLIAVPFEALTLKMETVGAVEKAYDSEEIPAEEAAEGETAAEEPEINVDAITGPQRWVVELNATEEMLAEAPEYTEDTREALLLDKSENGVFGFWMAGKVETDTEAEESSETQGAE